MPMWFIMHIKRYDNENLRFSIYIETLLTKFYKILLSYITPSLQFSPLPSPSLNFK